MEVMDVDDGEIDWSQPADLPPDCLKSLGDKLSSPAGIQGPCWETVADALNFGNEKRSNIGVSSRLLQMSEGHALLYDWTSGNNKAHSLQVLRTALLACNRDDIMDEFMKGVKSKYWENVGEKMEKYLPRRNIHPKSNCVQKTGKVCTTEMHEVTLHVVVAVPQDMPDHETRPQNVKAKVKSNYTLARAIGHHIGNIHEYEITIPKDATWQSPAKLFKGQQIFITKKHPQEDTDLKQIRASSDQTAMKETTTLDLKLNIPPNESPKVFNNDLNRLTLSCPMDECDTPMFTSCECNNSWDSADGCDSDIGLTPFFGLKHEGQDTADSSTKRPREIDDDSDDSNDDGNADSILKPVAISKDRPGPDFFHHSQSCPSPHCPEKETSSLVRRLSEPGMSKRVKSRLYIPRVTRSFDIAGLSYWHGQITMEEMENRMVTYLSKDGYFMVWSYKGDTEQEDKLVISVTHNGQLLHYNIRARAVDGRICYYLFKKEYVAQNALTLVEYYSIHSLESRSNTDNGRLIKLRKAVPKRLQSKLSPSPYFYVEPN